jgi:hypothetical protein
MSWTGSRLPPGSRPIPAERQQARGALQAANLPLALRAELLPALENLVARYPLEGLWLFGSWARGTASRRSNEDLLVMGLSYKRLLDAYDAVLEGCRYPWARREHAIGLGCGCGRPGTICGRARNFWPGQRRNWDDRERQDRRQVGRGRVAD